MVIWIVNEAVMPAENISNSAALDKVLSLNVEMKSIQNAIALSAMLILIYSSYIEYRRTRKKSFVVVIGFISVSALLFVYMIFTML